MGKNMQSRRPDFDAGSTPVHVHTQSPSREDMKLEREARKEGGVMIEATAEERLAVIMRQDPNEGKVPG